MNAGPGGFALNYSLFGVVEGFVEEEELPESEDGAALSAAFDSLALLLPSPDAFIEEPLPFEA
ncbi:MAG TPA: hypothetical protein VHX37_17350 [Acidobacteriaceae bacterium]|jgi:hypothetical protein|nr:hypothetical protein [Acidobacteriaceae bacterium]